MNAASRNGPNYSRLQVFGGLRGPLADRHDVFLDITRARSPAVAEAQVRSALMTNPVSEPNAPTEAAVDAPDDVTVDVSVIMPVLNEERHLAEAVAAVLNQDFDGSLEVILALGPSTDKTDEVAAALASNDGRVRLVQNPSGRTPVGLNAALAVAAAPIVVRVDGHCELPRDYISVAVECLNRTGADNVGGVMAAEGTTPFECAVAVAMRSPLGVGGAPFHVGGEEGEAPTVYLGAFRAETLARVGGYDEGFDRAQDWEMNHRIRRSGGLVWFNPNLTVSYRPRSTVRALAKQYFQYGSWRREVMRRHPETVSLRYLAPPAAVTAIAVGSVAAVAGTRGIAPRIARLGAVAPLGYLAAVTVGGLAISRRQPAAVRPVVPLVLVTMHMSWGVGFLTSRPKLRNR